MANTYGVYGDPTQTPQSSSHSPALLPESSTSSLRDRKKKQQPRQLLSCTKCRERKVKCDRTKPCSACCARGLPKECHFVLGEGTEFGPIQQSLELRKLRSENQRLKERLISAKLSLSDESDDDDESSTGRPGTGGRRTASRQKRFGTSDHTDSLYFGSPGLANVISDFANMQVEPKSLAFTMPRGADMYAGHISMYPFPALWHATTATEGLLRCLEPRESLLAYMDTFADKAVGFAFPFLPEELTHKEVEHFLQDAEQNAVMYPDALALILAGSALGCQLGGQDEDAKHRQDRLQRGDVFIAAVMQALRASGFMSRPTFRSILALLIIGLYLTNSGRFLDAWTIFGVTIRLAQSIGLHRNPKYLDPVPELRECTLRSSIWWWMLHIDQLYSMTLGRPLGISGIGDCSPAESLTTNPAVLRLGEFVDQLTILGRQILSSNQLSDARIDMFTDRLTALWDTIPDTLQFSESWSHPDAQIPEYPLCATAAIHFCKIHSYIILLNRQRIENTRGSPEYGSPSPRSYQAMLSGQNYGELPLLRAHTIPRGRPMVIQSSLALINAFVYFFKRVPLALIDWTVGQQAFNACLILLLDALETADVQHVGKVEQGYAVFVQLDKDNLHQLAELAVSRISEGLVRLRDMTEQKNADDISMEENRSGAGGSESRFYTEPVMGTTGMFLLEDPGLQSSRVSTTSPMERSTRPVDIPRPPLRRHSTHPMQQQRPPAEQSNVLAHPTHPQTQPNTYPHHYMSGSGSNYTSHQGSSYAVGFQPRLNPRRDSVTAGSGHVVSRMVGSTSPRGTGNGPFGPPAMQAPHYSVPLIAQQPRQQQQQQMMMAPHLSEQEWHEMRMQQMAQARTMQHGQMFPPRPPGQ